MKQSDYEKLSTPQRQKTSVAIIGLDRSTPDDIVKDGACEELHNVRYKDNAWRPVHEHSTTAVLLDDIVAEFDIVYHHPAAGENTYIARYKDEPDEYVTIALHEDEQPTIAYIDTIRNVDSITHFGNVLIFNVGTSNVYFFFQDSKYIKFSFPQAPNVRSITKTLYPMKPWKYIGSEGAWKDYTDDSIGDISKVVYPIANMQSHNPMISTFSTTDEIEQQDAWHGEVAFFVAYRMIDGTIISPSMMHIIASERDISNNQRYLTTGMYGESDRYLAIEHHYTTAPYEDNAMQYVKGEAIFSIPNDINTDIIDSIVCYATRIYSIFDYSKLIDKEGIFGIQNAYANNNLPVQPFYLMQSKAIVKGVSSFGFSLTRTNLENIETNTLYLPNNNVHVIRGGGNFDYNNRLHLFDTQTKLFDGYDISNFLSPSIATDLTQYDIATVIEANGLSYYAHQSSNINSIPPSPYPTPLILSYPDYRAKKYLIQRGTDMATHFELQPSVSNNIAYFVNSPTKSLKYPPITLSWADNYISIPNRDIITQPNNIQVSAPNNCFSFPFENSYAVGSSNNRILALQSAAIEMHEMKVGELPLYAFTEEGIFALVAGSNTLYASVAAINYDKIINPNTLAINGAIVYITEKGVHLLTSQGTQVISTPIHDSAGMPPLDFLRSCKIIHPKQYNEIVLLNETDKEGVAYVYNLDAGYWSTRDLEGFKLNTDELYLGNTIYDLADEDESKALPMTITTRPIKLGNIEFKRLDTIVPRMSSGDKTVMSHVHLTGSVNGTDYMTLREHEIEIEPHKVNPFTLRRTPFSAKYFKYHMFMEPKQGETFNPSITHIDFEWYIKFMRRMR